MDLHISKHALMRGRTRASLDTKNLRWFIEQAWKGWLQGKPKSLHWVSSPVTLNAEFWVPVRIELKPYFITCRWKVWDDITATSVIPVETVSYVTIWNHLMGEHLRWRENHKEPIDDPATPGADSPP